MVDPIKQSSKLSKLSLPDTLSDEEYKFIKVLGNGAQGVVCLYQEIATG